MWINWFVLIFLVMSHVIYFVIVVEYLFFFISSGKSMNVSFLPSVIEGKEVGLRKRCPCGHSWPQEAEWVCAKLTSISMPGNRKKTP